MLAGSKIVLLFENVSFHNFVHKILSRDAINVDCRLSQSVDVKEKYFNQSTITMYSIMKNNHIFKVYILYRAKNSQLQKRDFKTLLDRNDHIQR